MKKTIKNLETGREIQSRFEAVVFNKTQQFHAETLKEFSKKFVRQLNAHCHDSREKSLAITKFEECMMWANKAIAFHGKTDE